MSVQSGLERLNNLLPLKPRQDLLPEKLKNLHQSILRTLVEKGQTLSQQELQQILGEESLSTAIQRLGKDDLVVLDKDKKYPLGSYPVTIEVTPHKLTFNNHVIHAMCALDAVSVAPVFTKEVTIESRCHVTQTPLVIDMQGDNIVQAKPSYDIMVGIRWQNPTAVAAHSLCMEMVFLKDKETAVAWQNGDEENISLYNLADAVTFGKAYFSPLLTD